MGKCLLHKREDLSLNPQHIHKSQIESMTPAQRGVDTGGSLRLDDLEGDSKDRES